MLSLRTPHVHAAPRCSLSREKFAGAFSAAATVVFALALTAQMTRATTLPANFGETTVATGLSGGTAMAFAPDGRLFVCRQNGQLRVIKNGTLLAAPFVSLTVDSNGERGLLGVAFDPAFSANKFVYLYYTVPTAAGVPAHNRVSRFTADGDVALAGSETILLELDSLTSATNHNGGALHFGEDGKLYIAVGENATAANAQSKNNLLGKILRINADGTIPTDNPFLPTTVGKNQAIWALGLRNPYTFAFQPVTRRMFINDVGQSAWEEINDGAAGANYGWPATEGATNNPSYNSPLFAYGHSGSAATTGCAITGGAFYNPPTGQFPAEYVGQYFFADFCSGWIRKLNPASNTATDFASNAQNPVDLKVGPDGALYYLSYGGSIFKIFYATTANITAPAVGTTYRGGQQITYAGTAGDAQNADLPASAFTWKVEFHREGQITTVVPATIGVKTGSFFAVATGDSPVSVFYRIIMSVRDSFGNTTTTTRDVSPLTVVITLNSAPANLQLTLDGQIQTAPFVGIAGTVRRIGVVTPQVYNNASYVFSAWSDGGAMTHDVTLPDAPTTYTATFVPSASAPAVRLLTEEGSPLRAAALEATTMTRDPFPVINRHNFSADARSRVGLYAVNLQLASGETSAAVTAQAIDGTTRVYQLPVERVETVPGFNWLTEIVVALPPELSYVGDLNVSVAYRGARSNQVVIRTKPE